MSESVFLVDSQSLVNRLLCLDNEMKTKIVDEKNMSIDQIYQSYIDRLTFYEISNLVPMSESDKLLLKDKKEDLYVELKLFKLKREIKNQLDDVRSKLEDIQKNL